LQFELYRIILTSVLSNEKLKDVEIKNGNLLNLQNISIIFQLILLAAQILLAYQVFIVDKKAKKGYFLPQRTNIVTDKEHEAIFNEKFDLTKPLRFKNYGDDDIVLTRTKTILNNHTVDYSVVDSNGFFDNKGRFSFMYLQLDLSENELKKDSVVINVTFSLKNSKDYKYIQKITMEFKAESNGHLWILTKFNTEFGKRKAF
jgi:hypothetical protein